LGTVKQTLQKGFVLYHQNDPRVNLSQNHGSHSRM
jgi:hypothetical protein